MEKWSKEKAWNWYNSRPWIRGFNGYPSNCVNRVAMWQSYKHDEVIKQVEYEFALAQKTGLNAVRTILMFEVWLNEHDSFMDNLEEYISLADKYGLGVMLVFGNDCNVPKEFYTFRLGEQNVDWGYHSGIKRGQHSSTHATAGYQLNDEPEYTEKFYDMVREIAGKYCNDERVQIWNVWNEVGNSRRGTMSAEMMKKSFEIIRSFNQIQPLTADCWCYDADMQPFKEEQLLALELSDVVSFHYYGSFRNMVRIIKNLKERYDRPLINDEWLNRIEHNNVDEIFPLFWLEKVGSYHWGLIQGYSQTYEPWGCYMNDIENHDYHGENDYTKWQHDLYRFNGLPYIAKEVKIIKDFATLADKEFENKMKK